MTCVTLEVPTMGPEGWTGRDILQFLVNDVSICWDKDHKKRGHPVGGRGQKGTGTPVTVRW